jgi:4-hydroxyphenylacetate 3-monooxygenase
MAQALEAGMVWVNSENVRHLPTPFGGMKSSASAATAAITASTSIWRRRTSPSPRSRAWAPEEERGMPARTGKQFLEGLKRNPPNISIDGERIQDPTAHPATASAARSIAALYDLQYRPDLVDVMTYESPTTGDRVGMSFLETKTQDDLRRRARMHKVWADTSLGFIGRSPDYLNVNLMAAARAADYFAQNDPRFGENMQRYYEHVRENDLCLTHALTNPQVNRAARADELADPYIALGLVRETREGIIVRGARMMATLPIADEILIFPPPCSRSRRR